MSTFLQDVRYGVRMLRSGGAVTLVALVTLALGIGANTAIFSIVNGILLKPLPFERPGELLVVTERHGDRPISVSWLNYLDWRAERRVFDEMGASVGVFLNLTRDGVEPERLVGARATASYFRTLGTAALAGRTFTAQEDAAGGEPVAVLGEGAWRRLFGGEASAIGRSLTLNDTAYTVIGVMPAAFGIQNPPIDAWVSLGRAGDLMGPRGNHAGLTVVARMKPAVTLDEARVDLEAIASRLAREYAASNSNIGVLVEPMHERFVGKDLKRALLVLAGAVGFVLLIACANVANLLLARGAARQREIAVRTALGAGRGRLLRQLLTESVLLAGAGGVAGTLLGAWGLRALVAAVPDNLARAGAVRLDAQAFAFTAVLTLVTGVIFGLAPALHASKPDLNETLKQGGRSGTGRPRAERVRSALVVAQVALSLVLLASAGLMLRSFAELQSSSPGLDPKGAVTAGVALPASRYGNEAGRRQFVRRVIDRLEATAGVEAAATVTPLPLSLNGWQTSFLVEGQSEPEPGKYPTNDIARVTPGYFRAMGVRLLRGRVFTWADDENAPPVAIIDETFAGAWFANQDPIGRRIKLNAGHPPPGGPPPPWVTVVGVVAHVKNYGIDRESRVEVYVPYLQSPVGSLSLVSRGPADTATLGHAMRQAVREADPSLPIYTIRTMEEYLARTLTNKRLLMIVLALFAAVALTLAAVGIYGVMSYAVTQRTSEIGIRLALGAHPRAVLRLIVVRGMWLVAAGVVVGLVSSYWLTGLMSTLLFGVSATDPTTFTIVVSLLAGVAFLATWIPARRASTLDPLASIRTP